MTSPLPAGAGQPLFANAAGRIFDSGQGYVHLEWLPGAKQLEAYQAVFEHALQALRRSNSRLILSDQRLMPPTTPEAQRWVAENWLPRASRETGYAHCAVVLSENVFARLAALTWVGQYKPLPVTYQACVSVAEAANWLQQQVR